MEQHQHEERKEAQEKCKCGGELFKLRLVNYGFTVESECVKCGDKQEFGG